ncbi:P-loop containing nucleoside triphosphate hydrolase protein [Rhizoctonia solani]|uniref:Structural maintenance of chromosomes protein 5 n=1 Tax=Rhizoctonia solani TaxID=456999 RepID=A0A8H7M8H0_9AGAM|nr:P-loop containing nucleoside triphosphate hydrolase protein [Rhizoctonia solani]
MAPKRSRVTTPEEEVEDVMPSSRQVANGDGMEDLDNEDLQAEEGEDDGGGSEDEDGPTRKRTRLSEAGAGIDVEPKVEPGTQMKSRITLPRDPSDGFIPGSIVGIRLHNFLTYDDVDFRCGPHLNMLIGANGTGKSSIAGAIAIGLGGTPNVLGRQSEIQGFVKNGKKDGFVEIELKGPTGEPNLVIKRTLTSLNKSSKFFLNGEPTGIREVKIKLAELNVQVTNLCSAFLPQDKVSEFANMTPLKILQETQRAAGDPNLTQWHETLIENSKELKLAREILDSDKRELQHLESQNAAQEAQVERYKQRRKLERQVELLSLLLPFAQYAESKLQYDELKKKRESAKGMLEEANAKIEPIQRKKEEFAAHVRAANSVSRKAADKPLAVADKIKKKHGEQAEAEKESEAVLAQREEIKKEPRLAKIGFPDVGDTAELNEQRSNLQHEHRLKTEEYRLLQDEQRRIATEISVRKDRVAEAQRGWEILALSLNDIASQRMHRLRQADQDAADVATWLSKNQNMFKEEIIMPPMLSVFVKDTKYQAQIESLFNINNLKTFICQNEDDYRKMNKSVNDDGIIGRKVRVNIWWRPLSDSQPPVPQENVPNSGEIKAISLREDANIVAMTSAVTEQGGGAFITGQTAHQVSRSQYGRRLAQTATRKITGARLFTGSQVDTERQRELEQIIVNARAEMDAEEAKMGEVNIRDQPLRNTISELTDKINGIKEQINKINAAKKQHEFTKVKLSNRRKELKEEESKPEPKEEEEKLKKKLLKSAIKRAGIMHEAVALFDKLHEAQMEATRAALRHQQAVANANAVEKLLSTYEQEVLRVKKDYEKIDEEFQRAKATSKRLLETTKAKITQVSDELRNEFQTNYQDKGNTPSVQEVEDELTAKQAELELNHPMNPEVIRQYEARAVNIANLREKVETQEKKTNKLNARVEKTKAKWKPALDELVEQISRKFSAAFDRIRRAGEIHVRDAGDDYANWAIDILVKFRETEKLQILDAHRQSGGERSLSTIMYLLSLTEYARVPFSLVDEINQGMDASAERDVHNQLVEVTCNTDCGQYFLITPKLLTGLHYHEKMKVLCVNNGDWMMHPEPPVPNAGNLMKLVENYANRAVTASA